MTDEQKKDVYAVLGVARDADEDGIRKAYRQLARRYHPDVNPGDQEAEERFKAISTAYSVLSDADRRRDYDEFGEISLEAGFDAEKARQAREAFGARFGGGPGDGPGSQPFGFDGGFGRHAGESFHFDNLEGLFSDLFSRRGWQGAPARRGRDLEAELELDFMDAACGGEHRLSFARPGAAGSLRQETVTVRIPAGVADGGRIRLSGKGAEGTDGGDAGDLYARIRIRPHPVFRRDGRNLWFDLPVTVREATLGAKVEVPTLDGRVTLTIPAGTDSGTRLRLRGKGVPDPSGGSPGDLHAVIQIRVPRNVPTETAGRFDDLAEYDPADIRKELF
ncbi:MAG: DnaJ domain-containing protein [Myxococcales bacterium]|nr:DnaJ domain-containing protein [Myxococcales bacterium]